MTIVKEVELNKEGNMVSPIVLIDSVKNLDGTKYKDSIYTKSEVDIKLAEKSDNSHSHNDRYYTKSEVDIKLSTKMNIPSQSSVTSFPIGSIVTCAMSEAKPTGYTFSLSCDSEYKYFYDRANAGGLVSKIDIDGTWVCLSNTMYYASNSKYIHLAQRIS